MKKYILILIFQVVANSYGLSQNNEQLKIDSLKKILSSLKDTARIDCLNALSYLYIRGEQKDSAEHYTNIAFCEAEIRNYSHGIAVSFSQKADMANHFDNEFRKAVKLAKESMKWYERTNNKAGIDTAYSCLMGSLFSESRFDEIIDYYKKNYAVAKQKRDVPKILLSLSELLAVYRETGNYEQSFLFAQERFELATRANDKLAISSSLFRIGELYKLVEDYANALLYFRQVRAMDDDDTRRRRIAVGSDIYFKLEFAELFSHLHQFDSAWYYFNLFKPGKDHVAQMRLYWVSTGECYLLQQDYPHALQNFELGLTEHRKMGDHIGIMYTVFFIAKAYLAMGNNSAALKYGREALNMALQSKAKHVIRDGYQIVYSVYERWHRTDSAYFYYNKYIAMKDIVASDQLKGKFVAYNYEKKIELLDKEKQIEETKFKTETLHKRVLIAGIVTLLLLGMITFRNILLKRRNEAHRREIAENELQLKKNELQLQKLESEKKQEELQLKAMVATQEEERKRISRDLHDDVGTRLSALKLFLSSLNEKASYTNNEEIRSLAESSEQFVSEAMQDVRQLLLNLSPTVLEEFGYTTAVEGLVNKINEANKITFTLVVFGMEKTLQKDYELALYRITQELINNVLKHAKAKHVSLQIGQRDEKIILMMEDDGKGFDVSVRKDGYGLHNLDTRTKLMHGTMNIDSQPGKGTSVLIEIPYNYN